MRRRGSCGRLMRTTPITSTTYDQQAEEQRVHHLQFRLRCGFGGSSSAISTATTRDAPGSGMVIPISWFAISIVILLWLMNRNCVA